ncbi:MAG: phosphate ABC transporter substrate-binding protein PstS [Deltaproteobacteria bacterium]|nr:phosphate ABC transporter substrate-binding protein PstS [Deltaproteobacteria bacterium]MBW1952044.1 phosphate ABC transporter substrate-binding protein PstS [Deltaproteobacteria bacterium]MBW1986937.1 phosphate ABC transporter substrate-binding protein PstS [Deltaproteobacteria bacterium]MBW2134074.1 phosphate ABC transporter substrate-binding protein PstS [Deltaproteobacteria bacterium]
MKKTLCLGLSLAFILGIVGLAQAETMKINGAGASFPYPVYSQWAHKYKNLKGIEVNYQSIGSGGGIAQIKAKTVNFGGTDKPLKLAEQKASDLLMFPMLIGGIVPVVNIPGIKAGELQLSQELLADIFLGKIKSWNDPAIKKVNPKLKLPQQAITIVHRADGSGSTWLFTHYLSQISPDWKAKVGYGKVVSWPTGIGAKGNEGVAANVNRIAGSIGYVEYAYAIKGKLTYAKLQNQAGKFVAPSIESFQSAAAYADWQNAPGYYMVLTNQPGDNTWPIAGATFILINKTQPDAKLAKAMLEYFDWCFKHGSDIAEKLHYVPMPQEVIKMVEASWTQEVKADGQAVWQ